VISDSDGATVIAAVEALGKLRDSRAVEPLLRLLGKVSGEDRRTVARVLDELGESKWKGLIEGNTADFSRLGQTGDVRVFEPLVAALHNKDKDWRRSAARSLVTAVTSAMKNGLKSQFSIERWQQIRSTVQSHLDHEHPHGDWNEPHSDYKDHTCSHTDGSSHHDEHRHKDTGIGVAWPFTPAQMELFVAPPAGPSGGSQLSPPPTGTVRTQGTVYVVVCPGCRHSLRVCSAHAGKQGRCPKCKQVVDVPMSPPTDSTPDF